MMMALAFILGYGVTFFVFMLQLTREVVFEANYSSAVDIQGVILHFPCKTCRNEVFFTHHSTVTCGNCGSAYNVFARKSKLKVELALGENDEVYECIDCHGVFVLKAGIHESLMKCPNPACGREYYVLEKVNPHRSFYVKPIKRQKWW